MNNNIKKLIKQIIKEELKNVDTSSDGPFGKVVFAPNRTDNIDKTEKNTEFEQKVFDALVYHVFDNSKEDLEELFDKLYALSKQGDYDFFLSPPSSNAYRVLFDVPLERGAQILNVSEEEIINNTNKAVFAPNAKILNPLHRQIQSWTIEPDAHLLYALSQDAVMSSGLFIIAQTHTNNGKFILNPDFLEKIYDLEEFADEQEVISKGPVKLTGASYLYVPKESLLTIDVENVITTLMRVLLKH